MKKIAYTKEQVEAIYDEMDRRIQMDIDDGEFKWESEVVEYRKAMLQGIYGTLMVTATDWPQITWWIEDIEDERYANEEAPMKQWSRKRG